MTRNLRPIKFMSFRKGNFWLLKFDFPSSSSCFPTSIIFWSWWYQSLQSLPLKMTGDSSLLIYFYNIYNSFLLIFFIELRKITTFVSIITRHCFPFIDCWFFKVVFDLQFCPIFFLILIKYNYNIKILVFKVDDILSFFWVVIPWTHLKYMAVAVIGGR